MKKSQMLPMILVVIFFFLLNHGAQAIGEENKATQNSYEEFMKVLIDRHKSIQSEIMGGKFPVLVTVSIDDKPMEDRIKSLITKKLRDLGDVSIKNDWNDAIASIHIVAILEKRIKRVDSSVVMCRNSEYRSIVSNPENAFFIGAEEYITSYVLTNRTDSFSSNINVVISSFDTQVLEPIRQLKEIIEIKEKKQ